MKDKFTSEEKTEILNGFDELFFRNNTIARKKLIEKNEKCELTEEYQKEVMEYFESEDKRLKELKARLIECLY